MKQTPQKFACLEEEICSELLLDGRRGEALSATVSFLCKGSSTASSRLLHSLSSELSEDMTFTLKEKDSDEMAISTNLYWQLALPVLVG